MSPAVQPSTPHRWHRPLFVLAAIMTWVLVSSGGVVCVFDASVGCPDWPACHGRLIPPMQLKPLIEWSHRIASPITLPVIITTAVVAWRRYRNQPWVVWTVLGGIAAIINVVLYGAIGVFWGLNRGWAAADLGTALLSLALMVVAAVVVSAVAAEPGHQHRLSLERPFTKLALAAAGGVYAVLVSGVLVARPHSVVRCLGWPDLLAIAAPTDGFEQLQLARLGLAALAAALVAATVFQAWRTQRDRPVLRRHASIAAVLLMAACVAGALMPSPDQGLVVPLITMITASSLWASLVAVWARSALS